MKQKSKKKSKITSGILVDIVLKFIGEIFMRAGIPDIICCLKGRFIGIECKDGDNSASDLQIAHGLQIKKSGGLFCIAKSVEDVKIFLEKNKF